MCSIKNPNDVVMNYIRETNKTHVQIEHMYGNLGLPDLFTGFPKSYVELIVLCYFCLFVFVCVFDRGVYYSEY